ncbi:MAG: aminotransferase class I/II-fold pyridoxal phosphate-dependent enzyme [Candidatus Omnitrophota bacterium]
MSDMTIHLDAPDIGAVEKAKVLEAMDIGYVSTFGPLVGEFERQFAARAGAAQAVAMQSGTAALHLALHLLGVKTGDEVIIPSLTFAATLHAVMYVGATPVIVDVDPQTWCLSPQALSAAITPKTKAVMPVHLYGNVCDMMAINTVAKKAGIYVVEDATESLGAYFHGQHTGLLGDIGCVSFNGNKLITTGSGGMMVARSSDLLRRAVYLINQANPREGMDGFQEVGFNYRMPNMNAALGMAQFSRLDSFLALKKAFHRIYQLRLGDSGLCVMQKAHEGIDPSWWFTAVLFKDQAEAAAVQAALKEKGIPSRRLFRPLETFPYATGFCSRRCVNAEMLYARGLCLPSSTLNTEASIGRVCDTIADAVMKI